MSEFHDDLIAQLEADGVGTLGVNLFLSTKSAVPMLASGAATFAVVRTGGSGPDKVQNVIRPALLRPAAQCTARADSFDVAFAMARSGYDSLTKVQNQTIGTNHYLRIDALQEPFDGGVDDRGQSQVQFNVIAMYSRGA